MILPYYYLIEGAYLMKSKLKFVISILGFQLIASVILKLLYTYVYTYDLKYVQGKYLFSPTIFISIIFIIAVAVLSFKLSKNLGKYFTSSGIAFTLLIPFISFPVFIQSIESYQVKYYIAQILTYSFAHLSGFRELFVAIVGLDAIYNPFISINITILVHMIGFILGDTIYLIWNQKLNKYLKTA